MLSIHPMTLICLVSVSSTFWAIAAIGFGWREVAGGFLLLALLLSIVGVAHDLRRRAGDMKEM